ncbi:hypothetical protein GA0115259_106214 [Streptomyces sp. MnatMP-M17]|nr:hypothetical protein GA0115259_106214 [Streptomyces sp. MnatMP-M17]
MNPAERSLRARFAAHKSWGNTLDRAGRTAAARKASHHTRFVVQARELHPDATDEQIDQVVSSLRKAHYAKLALLSAQARRRKRRGEGT